MATENWLPSEMTEFDSFELEQNGTEMRRSLKDMQRIVKGSHTQISLDEVYANSWVRVNSEDANLVNCSCFTV